MSNLRQNTQVCSRHLHTLLPLPLLGRHMLLPHLPLPTHLTGLMHPAQGRREGSMGHHHVEGSSHLLPQVKIMSLMTVTLVCPQLSGSDATRGTRANMPRPLLFTRHRTPLWRNRGKEPASPDPVRPASRWDWKDGSDFEPQIYNFDQSSSGIKEQSLRADSRECEFYNYFWDENILETIVAQPNRYMYFMQGGRVLSRESREHQWYDITVSEMRVFLALVMLMGVVKKNNYRDYWSTNPLIQTPIFSKVMPVNRFVNILQALHFTDNLEAFANNITEKINKIRIVFDHLRRKFKEAFYPYKNVNIDENLMLWRGNISFRQYTPSKRHRFGLKLFSLCDCKTGFVQDIVLYTGSRTEITDDRSLGLSGAVVMTLMEPYLDNNHVLFIDN